MKTLAFTHRNDTRFAIGDFYPALSVFSHYELGNTISPFLLLDHLGPGVLKPTRLRKGVTEHPHRGFETITVIFAGELEHRDSSGGGGVIGPGDVQWMTAASGVLHTETFSEAFSIAGGAFEMIQFWVNLPAKDKMKAARYQSIRSADIPRISLDHSAAYVRVIAGQYMNSTGPAATHTPVRVFDVHLPAGERITLPADAGDTTIIYLRSGRLQFAPEEEVVQEQSMAMMSSQGENVEITALQNSDLLFLSAQPLNEPIHARGQFVMNSYAEILQAYDDLKAGKFLNPPISD
ncbi:pirin family protein [Acinetobacter sp. WZC-1]|uniref:pirin family protein n=1 Tax=Acinetobacter sp. WZC-1 TaxID=3459034 RepID=UPI00403D5D83